MFKLLREVLKNGEVTVKYPFQPVETLPGFRGRPVYDPAACIACASCAIACPPNAIQFETDLDRGVRTWSIFYGRCIYCARCEEVCPTRAISLSSDFELAVMDRGDLFIRSDFALAACCSCSQYFAPVKELEYVNRLMQEIGLKDEVGADPSSWLSLCPECRRKTDILFIRNLVQEAE